MLPRSTFCLVGHALQERRAHDVWLSENEGQGEPTDKLLHTTVSSGDAIEPMEPSKGVSGEGGASVGAEAEGGVMGGGSESCSLAHGGSRRLEPVCACVWGGGAEMWK